MKNDKRHCQKQELQALGDALFQELKSDEQLTLSYSGEESLFMRVNQAKVRQASEISQDSLSMTFISGHRRIESSFSLTSDVQEDLKRSQKSLEQCRIACQILPEDPYVVFPEAGENSEEDHYGHLLTRENLAETLLKPAQSEDMAGIFTSGTLMRAHMNSKGKFHWFSTDNFYFDYSLYTSSQKAIKANYAGTTWKNADYLFTLEKAKSQLKLLEKKPQKLKRGKYRVYLAPAAVAEIVNGLSWYAFSGQAVMQGHSPFKKMFEGTAHLSHLLSLEEDFHQGLTPRFNEFGEVAPSKVSLMHQGHLKSLLINQRTAQEYSLESNGANLLERLRSPRISPGSLRDENILSQLGTGLYISNLHYINWSDLQEGRLTGMTRYGCFWVENGEITSPIEDMRFDETLFHFWGTGLENLGEKVELIPPTFSYRERSLGGISVPGMLINDFSFTY